MDRWEPGRHAVEVWRFAASSAGERPLILISHVRAPAVRVLSESPGFDAIRDFAHAYLVVLEDHLAAVAEPGEPAGIGLPAGWLEALDPSGEGTPYFGWISPTVDGIDRTPPGASLRLRRFDIPQRGKPVPLPGETVVIAARESVPEGGRRYPINAAFGLEVTINITPQGENGWRMAATGMTAHLPHPPYLMLFEAWEGLGAFVPQFASFPELGKFATEMGPDLLRGAGLDPGTAAGIDELMIVSRLPGQHEIEIVGRGNGHAPPGVAPLAYRFRACIDAHRRMRLLSREPLVAEVGVRVFEQDPASWRGDPAAPVPTWIERRPTREALDRFRIEADVPEVLATDDFRVRNCPDFVPGDDNSTPTRRISPAGPAPAVRDNEQSAIAAYWNARDFFCLMRSFGILPEDYFRCARLPVDIYYRSGIRPGPGKDGQTINAQVRIRDLTERGFLRDAPPFVLEMHLALANLSRRARHPDVADGRAVPLGIANSERWMMHEFGHVLIAARFGNQLEFRFAHSAGDALAAIWADPRSWFAAPGAPAGARGWTYPWVFTTRRHDRRAADGWSWCGSFQQPVAGTSGVSPNRRKGYLSEQILSSSLFRLYRVVGGDTILPSGEPDVARREAASRLVIYLIIRAIQGFCHAPDRAEELAAKLMDADVGLFQPLPIGPQRVWRGGTGHKAVRWAFEAQGMYWPPGSGIRNAPGEPPEVDIYIGNRRPLSESGDGGITRFGPGGYAPVSLDWSTGLWMGALGQNGQPHLGIGNRGRSPAPGTAIRGWIGALLVDPETEAGQLDANGVDWIEAFTLGDVGTVPPGATPGAPMELGAAVAGLATGMVLVVEASCPDDAANTDPAAQLPTAIPPGAMPPTQLASLTDLVANDNNLALWRL